MPFLCNLSCASRPLRLTCELIHRMLEIIAERRLSFGHVSSFSRKEDTGSSSNINSPLRKVQTLILVLSKSGKAEPCNMITLTILKLSYSIELFRPAHFPVPFLRWQVIDCVDRKDDLAQWRSLDLCQYV